MARIVIDGKDKVVGRLATKVARLAILGNEVVVVNCEKAIISGNRRDIIERYKERLERGSTEKGPFQPKRPDRFVRRIIRGMMNYKSYKGKPAFRRVKTFIGVPDEYKGQIKEIDLKKADDLEYYKFITVGEVCKELGGKW